jgi:hypothetical protein
MNETKLKRLSIAGLSGFILIILCASSHIGIQLILKRLLNEV